jgi:hypothetical protein
MGGGFTQRRKGRRKGAKTLMPLCVLFASLRETSPRYLLFLLFSAIIYTANAQQVTDLRKAFANPPASAKPWVFWYWMQASVSKEGITADLKAMSEAGIGGAYLMPIKGPANPPLMDSSIVQLTPAWWNLVKFAFAEAKRFNIKLGLHASDGFALAGGPWITPENSMQKVVWSQRNIHGGKLFNDTLAQPETLEGYYKDIAILAYPSLVGADISTQTIKPVISSSKQDSTVLLLTDANNRRTFGCDEQCWIEYEFERPFTCRTIVIRSRNNYQSNRLIIQVSDDKKNYTTVTRLEPPRHGWQDWDSDYTHSIPATTARYFRFVFDKTGTEPGAEDLDAAKWKPTFRVTGIELLSEPRIHQYEGKNGEVWRISKATDANTIPDSICVAPDKIIYLTSNVDKNGRLNWDAPPGNWTILRIGHTSTGHKNETGGGGKGLECDKFNPAAITLQYNNWFGEAVKQIGPELAKEVLTNFHVDSWECGSQNWSLVFKDEFKKRRGYDLTLSLPMMAGVPVQSAEASENFLLDIRKTISELVHNKFYVTLKDLSHKQGYVFSAESVAPTMLSDGLLHYKSVDLPMGEFWLRSPTHDKPNDMLDAISGAHIYGKQIVQAEGFTQLRMAWDEHPAMLKTLGDRNFALGINRLFFHVFVHNPWMDRKPGMTLDAIGLYFQRDQTWWKQAKGWIGYVTRCQALLQLGKPVTDIAVFTGTDLPSRSVLPDRLVPLLPGIFGKEVVEREEKRLLNEGQPQRTLPAGVNHSANMADPENWIDPLKGYAYDSFNSDALFNLMNVRNGNIELTTGASYKLLIFPRATKMSPNGSWMPPDVLKITDRLFLSGARMLTRPYHDSSFARLGIEPDFLAYEKSGKRANGIAWTHRQGKDFDMYFISNQIDSAQQLQLSLRVSGKVPEIWDPLTGATYIADKWKTEKGRTVFPVRLHANGSAFIVLQKNTSGNKARVIQPVQTISQPWSVKFDTAFGGPEKSLLFLSLSGWSKNADSAIRFYSGTAVYTNKVQWKGSAKNVWLNVGKVHNIAEVFVNGISCGVAWTAPYRVNISKALKRGDNLISIHVSNTWANRIIGDLQLPPEKRLTRSIAPLRVLEGKPLLPAGLLGPVTLEMEQ